MRGFERVIAVVAVGLIIYLFCIENPIEPHQNQEVVEEPSIEIAVEIEHEEPEFQPEQVSKAQLEPENVETANAEDTKSDSSNSTSTENEGIFPPLKVSYKDQFRFEDYAIMMTKIGAIFLIPSGEDYLWRINWGTRNLEKVSLKSLQNAAFSPRTRVFSDEPGLASFVEKAKEKGISSPKVFMLVRQSTENKIYDQVAKGCSAEGISLKDVNFIQARYQKKSGQLNMHIQFVKLNTGKNLPLSMNLTL